MYRLLIKNLNIFMNYMLYSKHAFECMFHVQHVCEESYFHVQNGAYTELYCKKHIIKRSGPKRDP